VPLSVCLENTSEGVRVQHLYLITIVRNHCGGGRPRGGGGAGEGARPGRSGGGRLLGDGRRPLEPLGRRTDPEAVRRRLLAPPRPIDGAQQSAAEVLREEAVDVERQRVVGHLQHVCYRSKYLQIINVVKNPTKL